MGFEWKTWFRDVRHGGAIVLETDLRWCRSLHVEGFRCVRGSEDCVMKRPGGLFSAEGHRGLVSPLMQRIEEWVSRALRVPHCATCMFSVHPFAAVHLSFPMAN